VLLHYLAKRKTNFTRCVNALSEFNQSLLNFFSLLNSCLIFTLLYHSLNLVINAFSLGLLGEWFRRKESRALQGNAEGLSRWGGSNISAKNYCIRIVYVKIIASQRWDVFWDGVDGKMECRVRVWKWTRIKLKLWLVEKAAREYRILEGGHVVFVVAGVGRNSNTLY